MRTRREGLWWDQVPVPDTVDWLKAQRGGTLNEASTANQVW